MGPLGVRAPDRARRRRCGAGAPPAARPCPHAGGRGDRRRVVVSHDRDFADALGHALSASWGLVVAGGLLEVASVAGYVLLLHRVVSGASPRLRWRDSYDIALAGTAVTRLLPTAGLGGAAVTVWALRAHGVRTRELAERLLAFLVLLLPWHDGATCSRCPAA